jgi:transposase-like protein
MESFSLGSLRGELEKLVRSGHWRGAAKSRAEFLLAWDKNVGMSFAAKLCGISRKTAYVWRDAYLEEASKNPFGAVVTFIQDERRVGRPSFRPEEIRAALRKIAPKDVPSTPQLAKRIGVPERTLRRVLARHRRVPQSLPQA